MTPREVVGPGVCDGALVRLVTDETLCWVEIWTDTEWVRDTTTTAREVLMAPPVGTETLRRYGYHGESPKGTA